MCTKIRELNSLEIAIDKNTFLDILDELQGLRDLVLAQKEVIIKIADIKGKN